MSSSSPLHSTALVRDLTKHFRDAPKTPPEEIVSVLSSTTLNGGSKVNTGVRRICNVFTSNVNILVAIKVIHAPGANKCLDPRDIGRTTNEDDVTATGRKEPIEVCVH
jgi:hypothetical protein